MKFSIDRIHIAGSIMKNKNKTYTYVLELADSATLAVQCLHVQI